MTVIEIYCSINKAKQTTAGSLNVAFEIENRSDVAVRVMKRGTPLEGLLTDCLIVTANGNRFHYEGRVGKRRPPDESDFVLLTPGEKVANIVDVTRAYAIPGNAQVEIRFNETRLLIEPLEENAADHEIIITNKPLTLTTPQLPLPTEKALKPTTEAATDFLEQIGLKGLFKTLGLVEKLNPPRFTGGDGAQKKAVLAAHKKAYEMIKTSIKRLEMAMDLPFKTWFDDDPTEDRLAFVLENFRKIKKGMEQRNFTYSFSTYGCGPTDYAWTRTGETTIWLCNGFWEAPATGMSSKAGTIVHEHGHCSAMLEDYDYGEAYCKMLAKRYPIKAMTSAENYEFYAESVSS